MRPRRFFGLACVSERSANAEDIASLHVGELFEEVADGGLDGGEDGGVAFGVAGAFGFAEFLDEVEEIGGFFGFEGDDEFLVVEAEGIGGVEADGLVLVTDFDVFVHDALAGAFGEEVPLAFFDEGVDEDELVFAGIDDGAGFVVGGVELVDVGGAFGLGEEGVGGGEITGEGEAVDGGGEGLDIVEGEGDFPEEDIDVGACADAGVGEEDHFLVGGAGGFVVGFDEVGEAVEEGALLVGGEAAEVGEELVEGEGDELAAHGCSGGACAGRHGGGGVSGASGGGGFRHGERLRKIFAKGYFVR